MRNLMADEQFGLEPQIAHEKTRHAQIQDCQADGAMSCFSRAPTDELCARRPQLGLLLLN
jgi:hypothetical protein